MNKLNSVSRGRRVRSVLLASAGLFSLTIGGVAQAEEAADSKPAWDVLLEAQGNPGSDASVAPISYDVLTVNPQTTSISTSFAPVVDPEILIANPGTPTTARDPVNITGIGQVVTDSGGGSVGLCTGTLINPRTVIFAAHCVNTRAATAYGANSGGVGIAVGFETNTRANAPGETDELVRWLLGGTGGAGRFQTNTAQALYNVNWLNYNPFSLETASRGFLYGDVAIASLDTPAANVPTWALMFSPLANPGTIGAAGTGYNVGLVGYGRNGTGETGSGTSIDFRRRAAENILGALTDLQTFETWLFGSPASGLTQNLYFIDFDDPRRGMNTASPFDFNAFRDNARAGANGGPSLEGLTSQGDSGGPLILQNFSRQFVIGVLSGGYTRFFGGQPANGYGTVSFYQPLYLYWDWIAANNPYHYVASVAGNRQWTDPTNWVTTLDPAYYILTGGQPVNGIPTAVGEQKNGTSGDFGQICFQGTASGECLDTATGQPVFTGPIGTGNAPQQTGGAELSDGRLNVTLSGVDFDMVQLEAQAEQTAQALPAATLTNGLPGATNFVPNNTNPDRLAGIAPRYFDVTLAATGTTTLSGANVTIDRLTIGTGGAQLVIDSGASLTTLINTTQFAGFLNVNGSLTSVGDYSLLGGGILGNGTITAPFVSSVAGQFAPGTSTTVGTLNIVGNLVMSSGTNYLVNIGATGVSDRIVVTAGTAAGSGQANVGGTLSIVPAAGTLRAGNTYTILTSAAARTGTFTTPAAFSAILTPTLGYTANSVTLTITALPYVGVANQTPVQQSYSRLLDQNRNVASLAGIYQQLDLLDAASIRTLLDSLAPRSETQNRASGTGAIDNIGMFLRDRLGDLNPGDLGGSIAYMGNPLQLAASRVNNIMPGTALVRADAGEAMVQEGKLPEDFSGFIAAGYLDGSSAPMPTAIPLAGRDQFDGYFVAAGLEKEIGGNALIGVAGSYTDIDGTVAGANQTTGTRLYQGSVYAKFGPSDNSYLVDAIVSVGSLETRTVRQVNFLGTNYTLRTSDAALAWAAEVGVSAGIESEGVSFRPRIAARLTRIGYEDVSETGGLPALTYDREALVSVQFRAGGTVKGKGKIKPYLTANYVYDAGNQADAFGANFVGGVGNNASFAFAGTDKHWGEASAGISYATDRIELSVGADTTIERDSVENQTYRASIKFKL